MGRAAGPDGHPRSRASTSSGIGRACSGSPGDFGRPTHARTSKPCEQSRAPTAISEYAKAWLDVLSAEVGGAYDAADMVRRVPPCAGGLRVYLRRADARRVRCVFHERAERSRIPAV